MENIPNIKDFKFGHQTDIARAIKAPLPSPWSQEMPPSIENALRLIAPTRLLLLGAIHESVTHPIDPALLEKAGENSSLAPMPDIDSGIALDTIRLIRPSNPDNKRFNLWTQLAYRIIKSTLANHPEPDIEDISSRSQLDIDDVDALLNLVQKDNSLEALITQVTSQLYAADTIEKAKSMNVGNPEEIKTFITACLKPSWETINRKIRQRVKEKYKRELIAKKARDSEKLAIESMAQSTEEKYVNVLKYATELFPKLPKELQEQRLKVAENVAFLTVFYTSNDTKIQTFSLHEYNSLLKVLPGKYRDQFVNFYKPDINTDAPVPKQEYFRLLTFLVGLTSHDQESDTDLSKTISLLTEDIDNAISLDLLSKSSPATRAKFDKIRHDFATEKQKYILEMLWGNKANPPILTTTHLEEVYKFFYPEADKQIPFNLYLPPLNISLEPELNNNLQREVDINVQPDQKSELEEERNQNSDEQTNSEIESTVATHVESVDVTPQTEADSNNQQTPPNESDNEKGNNTDIEVDSQKIEEAALAHIEGVLERVNRGLLGLWKVRFIENGNFEAYKSQLLEMYQDLVVQSLAENTRRNNSLTGPLPTYDELVSTIIPEWNVESRMGDLSLEDFARQAGRKMVSPLSRLKKIEKSKPFFQSS